MALDQFYVQQTFVEGKPGLFRACYGSIEFGDAFTQEAAQFLVDQARSIKGYREMIERRNAQYEAHLYWAARFFRNEGGGKALVVVPEGQGRG